MNIVNKLIKEFSNQVIYDNKLMNPYLEDWRGIFRGKAQAIFFPKSTSEVSYLLKNLYQHNIQIIPQGGNSCQTAAAIPLVSTLVNTNKSKLPVIINMSKMDKIVNIDINNRSIVVESGAILADVQNKVSKKRLYFPLDLGAKKNAQIGGLLSTNAGGLNVLRYGNTREQTLGLEVVLPDGKVLPMLKTLRKNNTGYDLKQLFIGAEGTLGIITKAAFRLYPQAQFQKVVWLTCESFSKTIEVFSKINSVYFQAITAFEVIEQTPASLLNVININAPLKINNWQILFELESQNEIDVISLINQFKKDKIIIDAKVAKNHKESRCFWQCREEIPNSAKAVYGKQSNYTIIRHDIALPLSNMEKFISITTKKISKLIPNAIPIIFGHLGDGNLHFNIALENKHEHLREEVSKIVYDMVFKFSGTFSAEHGIGQVKTSAMYKYLDSVEIELMKKIRMIVDKKALMNYGKLF